MQKLIIKGQAGSLEFSNFDEIKTGLISFISEKYQGMNYEELGYDIAYRDKKELRKIKRVFSKKRLELKKVYTDPYLQVEAMFKDLEAIVDKPLKNANAYVERNDKLEKRNRIISYAKSRSLDLGDFVEKIVDSPAFFNQRWLNKSMKLPMIYEDVDDIIESSIRDIHSIKARGSDNENILLARYYETLSTTGLKAFEQSISQEDEKSNLETGSKKEAESIVENLKSTESISTLNSKFYEVKEEKFLKITASEKQIEAFFKYMEFEGIEYEEVDGE